MNFQEYKDSFGTYYQFNNIKDALVCNKPAIVNVEVDPKALYSFRKDSFKHRAK